VRCRASAWASVFVDGGVGSGAAAEEGGSWDVVGAVAASGAVGSGCGTCCALGSWVATGVGSGAGVLP
jgi:hypothetical protein